MSRLTQAKLQHALHAVHRLSSAVYDARYRYKSCAQLRPNRLAILSRLLKKLGGMSHTTDYQAFESELKYRLTQARRRVLGVGPDRECKSLSARLPGGAYRNEVEAFDEQTAYLLRVLADVAAALPPA